MEKWEYKSLEWIHKVREENYKRTKAMSPKELIEDTRKQTADLIKQWGLKIVQRTNFCSQKRQN